MTKQVKALNTYKGIDQALISQSQGSPMQNLDFTTFEPFNL